MNRFYHNSRIRFECQPDCASCCKISDGFVFLTDKEAVKIAKALDLSESEFLQHFTRIIDDQICLVDRDNEYCVFLEDNMCTIYDFRPAQCRTYPFWKENLKSRSRWQLVMEECPGIGKGQVYSAEKIESIIKNKKERRINV